MRTIILMLFSFCFVSILSTQEPVGIFENHIDIGNVIPPGKAHYDSQTGMYTVTCGGEGTGTQDEWHFVYSELNGPFHLKAKIRVEGNGFYHAGAALMVRNNLDPDSVFYAVALMNDWKAARFGRSYSGVNWVPESTDSNDVSTYDHTGEFELIREENNCSIYYINTNNERIHLDTRPVNLTDPVYVGLMITSFDDSVENIGFFSEVELIINEQSSVDNWDLYD